MKKCNNCGTLLEDTVVACESCGSSDVSAIGTVTEQVESENPYAVSAKEEIDINDNGHIFTGVVGALLFSVVGGIVYFVVYQLGVIAGICGFVMFALAGIGYRLFASTKNKLSVAGLIASIVATVIMIFVAEYACISYEIFKAFEADGATFFKAILAAPTFLAEPEISSAMISDLAFSYTFAALATGSNVINIIKARKSVK